jgi:transcriptional regulator with XRE-family HTH domain
MTTTNPRNCDDRTLNRRLAFGRAVRDARKATGLSPERLAERAGCNRQSINRVENGAYSPSLDRVWRLAAALDVPLSDLCLAVEANTYRTVRVAS